ncbi:hypothetical protein FIBSPDRAFT_899281 [Athelia psychrophila]|uniref:Uncharacterized protein n=1 Tax=Athelia psychrophila TaxID=1759441 RepID=A0A165ZXS5_9AGAM|nr:hypothetical protein FIBSPDRAFT_899281 [Fibularhizoctonia sp. CBS 109695]
MEGDGRVLREAGRRTVTQTRVLTQGVSRKCGKKAARHSRTPLGRFSGELVSGDQIAVWDAREKSQQASEILGVVGRGDPRSREGRARRPAGARFRARCMVEEAIIAYSACKEKKESPRSRRSVPSPLVCIFDFRIASRLMGGKRPAGTRIADIIELDDYHGIPDIHIRKIYVVTGHLNQPREPLRNCCTSLYITARFGDSIRKVTVLSDLWSHPVGLRSRLELD